MYGTLSNGNLIPAPRRIVLGEWQIINPTDEQYAEAGYLPVIHTDPPEAPEGFCPVSGWEEQGGEIVQVWHLEELPPEEAPTEAWDIEQSELIPAGRVITVRGTSYECIQEHTAAWSRRPPNAEYWRELC